MVVVHGMRILTELSFYYAFTSFVAVCYGGQYAIVGLLLQTGCFMLSAALRKSRMLRLVALLPMAVFWLLPNVGLTDTLLFLPPAVYLVWQVYSDMYPLEWSRQVELFSVFWKCYAGFVLSLLIFGMIAELNAASVPIAVIMLVDSVLLMRTLRHEPETYCQRRFMLMNAVSVAAVTAVAALISTELFLQTCLSLFKLFYNTFVLPILMLGVMVLMYALQVVVWLASILNIGLPEQHEKIQIQMTGVAEYLDLSEITGKPVGKEILILLGVVVTVSLLYLFFRWMSRIGWREKPTAAIGEIRITAAEDTSVPAVKLSHRSPVQRVRAQYRKFLKLYLSSGGELGKSYTSKDVNEEAKQRRFLPEAASELRDIYIRARYAGTAEPKDVSRAKELYGELKKDRQHSRDS